MCEAPIGSLASGSSLCMGTVTEQFLLLDELEKEVSSSQQPGSALAEDSGAGQVKWSFNIMSTGPCCIILIPHDGWHVPGKVGVL